MDFLTADSQNESLPDSTRGLTCITLNMFALWKSLSVQFDCQDRASKVYTELMLQVRSSEEILKQTVLSHGRMRGLTGPAADCRSRHKRGRSGHMAAGGRHASTAAARRSARGLTVMTAP